MYELPSIASLLASTPSSSSSPSSAVNQSEDSPDYDLPMPLPPPRLNAHPSLSIPMSNSQQIAFYAGNPAHKHMHESSSTPADSTKPKMRARPSPFQTEEMRKLYSANPHPTREEREQLCARIGMYVFDQLLTIARS
jgi:hypothetical protein